MIAIGNDNNITLKIGTETVTAAYLGTEQVYPNAAPTPSYDTKYLTFEAIESGTFQFNASGISYSLDDGSTWTSLAANTSTPTLQRGNKIMWKGQMTPVEFYGIGQFTSTGRYNVEGNPLSLIFGDNFVGEDDLTDYTNALYHLFGGTDVVNAQNLALVATTLSENCYNEMFQNCSSLVTAPALPATTLQNYCYGQMFNGCTSLTTAPELPATTLAEGCYQYMFSGCSSLTTAPTILPATTLVRGCYIGMFWGCTDLRTAPELPATTLVSSCYSQMFNSCTSLNYIKAIFTTTPNTSYTNNWVLNVAATGTFVKNENATWDVTGVYGVPSGWTVQYAASL